MTNKRATYYPLPGLRGRDREGGCSTARTRGKSPLPLPPPQAGGGGVAPPRPPLVFGPCAPPLGGGAPPRRGPGANAPPPPPPRKRGGERLPLAVPSCFVA